MSEFRDEQTVIGEVERDERNKIVVSQTRLKDKQYVDIRTWYRNRSNEGQWLPGKGSACRSSSLTGSWRCCRRSSKWRSLPRDTPSGGQMRNIWNPVDNTVAAIRYIASRYGTPQAIPGLESSSYAGY